MPSLRARFLVFLLRNRRLFRFRLKANAVDWTALESIVRFRRECEAGAARFGSMPPGIDVEPASAGGYVSGSCSDHRIHVSKFVAGSGVGALLFEYRLAPEHPYPAALDDSVAAYEWMLSQGVSPERVVFAGDSAGGGLCLATLVALRDRGVALPSAAVALSPWTDLACRGDSYRTNADRCLSPKGTWTAFSAHYAAGRDPADPLISPLCADLRGLPPLLLFAGSDEILLDDSTRFAERAKEAGVDVALRIGQGLFHCYPVCAPLFPEATQAMEEICAFIREHIGRGGALPE